METLPNCFQTNFQLFRKTIIGPVYFQTLPQTSRTNNLATRPSRCSNRYIPKGFEIPVSLYFITDLISNA